jgi:hypothetical protein
MTWRRVLVVGVLAGCILAAVGCVYSDSESDWVTFEGPWISLDLPDSFMGGDPRDPEVMPILREMSESRSDSQDRESLLQWLDNVDKIATPGTSLYLVALAAPDDGRSIAIVTVHRLPLRDLLDLTDGDSSMRALVDAYMDPVPREYWKIDNLKAEEASVIVRFGGRDNDPAELRASETFKESSETFRLTP